MSTITLDQYLAGLAALELKLKSDEGAGLVLRG